MTKHEQSAIIGHWRNGATEDEIRKATGFFDRQIWIVIFNHQITENERGNNTTVQPVTPTEDKLSAGNQD